MNPSMTSLWKERGVKYYAGICCAGMGVLFPVLNQRGVELGSLYVILFVALLGLGAILVRPPASVFRTILDGLAPRAPIIFLVTLFILLTMRENRPLMFAGRGIRLSDLLLCAGVLGYIAGHYRLQSVAKNVFPETAAEVERRADPDAEPQRNQVTARRAGAAVTPAEVGWLLLSLPAWAGLAQLTAEMLPTAHANPGLLPEAWRAVTLAWLIGAMGLLVSGLLDYYHRRHMSPAEATLYLQDVVWQETRREQRRINRWAAWGRLRCRQSIFSASVEWLGFLVLALLSAFGVMALVYVISMLD
jgi:hypothetical protein